MERSFDATEFIMQQNIYDAWLCAEKTVPPDSRFDPTRSVNPTARSNYIYIVSESESECKCLTCNQKPTGSQFSLLHELIKLKG